MKSLIVIFLVLIVSAVATLMFMEEPGYVLFAYADMSVQTTMAFFIIALVVILAVVYGLIRFLVGLFGLPGRMSEKRQQKKAVACQRGLALGLAEMTEGRYAKAEKLLVQSAKRGDAPMLNYLSAARAAQMQGAYDRRDEYLRQASQSGSNTEVAVGLTQAELQIAHGEHAQAISTLRHLNDVAPGNQQLLRLKARLCQEVGDSESLMGLMSDLRKAKAFDGETLEKLEVEAFTAQARDIAAANELGKLEGIWVNLPKASRNNAGMVVAYAQALVAMNEADRAEAVLRAAIKQHWDESLVRLYGRLNLSDVSRAIGYAEGWLRDHRRDATLLLTLGRLCKQAKVWGKARGYLESSISARPNPEAYRELGELLEQVGEEKLAQDAFRKGLQLAVDGAEAEAAPVAAIQPTTKKGKKAAKGGTAALPSLSSGTA
ncbi:HemY protein [Ectothiorhodospira magna]|uniref:HemY protein n=1 Tax=Ectothiorhodospira magna TaxID=867345 RepID=A0A1H9EXE9_9GAMM|nr:heme biosynthesis HemY N-terminal domain-containing protein [Ectothiorhodospira magna]SEQ29873.1 HemY protein [Ectothiorhodospira magna]